MDSYLELPCLNKIILSLNLNIIILLISDLFVPVYIYGNLGFGYFLALSLTLANKKLMDGKRI